MEFSCKTRYTQKTMTALARAVRKTMRAGRDRLLRIYSAAVMGLCLLCIWISWGEDLWRIVLDALVVVLLLLVNWKQDALNGFFARRKAFPGMEYAESTFYPDCYEVRITGAVTQWQYDKVLALAETRGYFLFVLGKNHAQAFDKSELEGGTPEQFRRFIQEQTGQQIRNIGGA